MARSIVPEHVVTPSLDLFSKRNKVLSNGDVEVRVTTFNKHGDFIQNGGRKVLPKTIYDKYVSLASAVYQTVPGPTSENKLQGTAFNIGNNLILTNNHVLDESFRNTSSCDGFGLYDHDEEKYECKKVHYCNPEHDICLIEMKPKKKTRRSCFFCAGETYEASLAKRPSLKLKNNYRPPYHDALKEIYTAIGNSNGFGIHYSEGRGAIINSEYIRFWAPSTSGNSGGPLLNKDGLVIGIVKHQTALTYSHDIDKTFNGAAPIDLTINLIRDALRSDPETLLKFNQSVIE